MGNPQQRGRLRDDICMDGAEAANAWPSILCLQKKVVVLTEFTRFCTAPITKQKMTLSQTCRKKTKCFGVKLSEKWLNLQFEH